MSTGKFADILNSILRSSEKPPLFEPGESLFWDDPHISRSMLEAHLNPDNDAASRRPEKIDSEVEHLISSGFLNPGDRVLDLGCGPGLYASRLAQRGIQVTGIDISDRSLNYARRYAEDNGLDIEYRKLNFFDIDYSDVFDAVLQTNGELNTFSGEKRDELLSKLHKALKPDGLLVFDVTTRALRMKFGLKNNWYVSDVGFWRPGRHLVLEDGLDFPENDVFLNRYIVVDDNRVAVYNLWFHDYNLESIRQVLVSAGFKLQHIWNDLTGTPYEDGGDWLAIVAGKN